MILVVDAEKDPQLTGRFFASLRSLNCKALGGLQLIVVTQGSENMPRLPEGVTHVPAGHPSVDGYPVWDVMESTRKVWPMLTGDYVTWAHPEFFLGPDRLGRTLAYLEARDPVVALGNLRRPGRDKTQWTSLNYSKPVSDTLSMWVDDGDERMVRHTCAMMPTMHWAYWREPPKLDDSRWIEDIFFARKDWLEAVGFNRDCGPMPFQDVYDLMGAVMRQTGKRGLKPDCVRLPREVHEAIHLWHPKSRTCFSVAMKAWFMEHAGEFADTRLVDWDLWDRLIDVTEHPKARAHPALMGFKQSPGGTVTRFAVHISDWLHGEGEGRLRQVYGDRNSIAAVAGDPVPV